MLFSSMIFLWMFIPVVGAAYFLVGERYKNYLLLIASLFFYGWGEPEYILLMVISIMFNYAVGVFIEGANTPFMQKLGIVIGVAVNVGTLAVFKYLGFVMQSLDSVTNIGVSVPTVILPIGISFYTFQAMSYIIDVYRGKSSGYTVGVRAQHSLADLALYISFFPQLIAGPIVNYKTIEKQLKERTHSYDDVALGMKRFIYGLGKKVLISNTVGQVVDRIYALPETELNTPIAWIGVICYTFQIYFDFSGYSDMAIGLGRMFGFKFLENFNYPYIAGSVQDFWRRWHISLSSWFREYLYIPLGGNRKGTAATYRNLLIVFFITGLWHGASWSFVIWGLWHGLFMIIERLFLARLLQKNPIKPLNHLYTIFVVIIGWVFFRAQSLGDATLVLKNMFVLNLNDAVSSMLYIDTEVVVTLMLALLLCGVLQCIPRVKQAVFSDKINRFEFILLPAVLFFCILSLTSGAYNPFIYFQF